MIAQDTLTPLTAAYRYDALNRLRQKSTFKNYQNVLSYSTSYTYDKMGNILTLNRFASNAPMDSLRYFYNAGTNQLNYVTDKINANNFPNDIDNQNPNNYTYDPTGNLIKDNSEGLEIKWTHYGKVKQVNKNSNDLLLFEYDATGNRSVKDNHQTQEKQIYIRDAQGNVMAVYQTRHDSLFLDELHLYGSSRLGLIKEQQFLTKKLTGGTPPPPQITPVYTLKFYNFGKKRYELADWLGNVRVVINDKKTPMGTNPQNMTYAAQTISVSDYYPFGMLARSYNAVAYRYGFNKGSEKDDEIYGSGNVYTTLFRALDVRLGRWWTIDPKTNLTPWESPYSSMSANPIWYNDVLGDYIVAIGGEAEQLLDYVMDKFGGEVFKKFIKLNKRQLKTENKELITIKYFSHILKSEKLSKKLSNEKRFGKQLNKALSKANLEKLNKQQIHQAYLLYTAIQSDYEIDVNVLTKGSGTQPRFDEGSSEGPSKIIEDKKARVSKNFDEFLKQFEENPKVLDTKEKGYLIVDPTENEKRGGHLGTIVIDRTNRSKESTTPSLFEGLEEINRK